MSPVYLSYFENIYPLVPVQLCLSFLSIDFQQFIVEECEKPGASSRPYLPRISNLQVLAEHNRTLKSIQNNNVAAGKAELLPLIWFLFFYTRRLSPWPWSD